MALAMMPKRNMVQRFIGSKVRNPPFSADPTSHFLPLELPPLPTAPPPMGNAVKLREICDDYCGFKVHRFEGSKVLLFII